MIPFALPALAILLGQGSSYTTRPKLTPPELAAALAKMPRVSVAETRILNPAENEEVPSKREFGDRLAAALRKNNVGVRSDDGPPGRVVPEARVWVDVNVFKSSVTGDFIYSATLKVDRLARVAATGTTVYATVWDMNTIGRNGDSDFREFVLQTVDDLAARFAKDWQSQNRERERDGTR